MRIGFDAKRAFMNSSGLGNYSRTLMKSLMDHFPEHDYTAFTPGMNDELGKELIDRPKLKIILPPPILRGVLSSWWRSSVISEHIIELKLDVYHGLSNELPKRIPFSTRKVVTIHDLIFLRHPEWYPFVDRNIYYRKFRNACKQADAVVAVSNQTKQDIMHYFNIPDAKIEVVYQAVGNRFSVKAPDADRKQFLIRYKLPEKYILYVGTIEERKNLLTLVKSMTKAAGFSLVVIGKKKKYYEKVSAFIRTNNLEQRIIFPENVGEAELVQFYRNAEVFVYPSRYEGFGIPVIEALSCGTPVIASSVTALPEAGGPGSLYFNPDDPDELSEKIKMVFGDSGLRDKMIRDGYSHLVKFDPKTAATRMMSVYKAGKQE